MAGKFPTTWGVVENRINAVEKSAAAKWAVVTPTTAMLRGQCSRPAVFLWSYAQRCSCCFKVTASKSAIHKYLYIFFIRKDKQTNMPYGWVFLWKDVLWSISRASLTNISSYYSWACSSAVAAWKRGIWVIVLKRKCLSIKYSNVLAILSYFWLIFTDDEALHSLWMLQPK